MTWKRVATAVVLMPVAIALVLWGSTPVLAVAVAVLTAVALWEYFGLGEAIGHRAYRVWTTVCALLLMYAQWAERYGDHGSGRLWCFSLPPITERATPLWVFFLFVLGHLAGNLQIYEGPEKLNAYSRFLHSMPGLLWGARVTLLAMVSLHIWSALQLALRNWDARPTGYARRKATNSSYASRTMYWSGPSFWRSSSTTSWISPSER